MSNLPTSPRTDLLGSIRLHKRLRKNPVWERPDYGYCWVDLLMLANDEDRETFVQGEKVALQRGQLCWSLRSLEKEWKKSGEWLTRFLQFLTDEGMITVDSNRRRTIITVLNYSAYNPTEAGSETVTDTGTEAGSETEQKGERGNGKRKGERASAPPETPFPEIPDDKTVECFCGSYRDVARGVTKGIGEVWWRGWMASRLGGRSPFPTDWQRALTSAFTADLIARHPKAVAAVSGAQSNHLDQGASEITPQKKNAAAILNGRSPAQARFELDKELKALTERLDAAHEIGVQPSAKDVAREREIRQQLRELAT